MHSEYTYKQPLRHNTADTVLKRADSGITFTNKGAAGAVKYTLPQDAAEGDKFQFVVLTAQQLQITGGAAGGIWCNGAKGAANGYVWADDEGESVTLISLGNGDWINFGQVGTWTAV